MALFDSILSSATGGVRNVYRGILGGLARQLPVKIPGLGESALPNQIPVMQYLGGPENNPLFSVVINAQNNDKDANGTKGKDVTITAFMETGGSLSLGAGAEYDAPFDQGLLEFLDSPRIAALVRMAGIRTVTQSMTSQVWTGSRHMGMTLNLLFIAQTDATKEVLLPIKKLIGLTLPSINDARFLSAPGPRVRLKAPEGTDGTLSGTISKGVTVMTNLGKSALKDFGGSGDNDKKETGDQTNIQSFKENAEAATTFFDVITVDNPISISVGNFLHFGSVVIKDVQANWEEIFDPSGQPMVAKVSVTFETHQVPTVEGLDAMFPTAGASTQATTGMIPGSAIAAGVNGIAGQVSNLGARALGGLFGGGG